MSSALLVVLVCLASYRLTRLLVRDTFPPLAVQRRRVEERWGRYSWQAYLSTCSWCSGVYISGLVVLATWLVLDHVPAPFLVWGTAAAVVGLLSGWEKVEDDEE